MDSNQKAKSKLQVFVVKIFNFSLFILNKIKGTLFFLKNKNSKLEQMKKQVDLDKKLVLSLSKARIPRLRQLKYINRYLSRSEFWLLYISLASLVISIIFWSGHFYVTHLEIVPKRSGTYIEGLVGQPKFINPLYSSISDVDSDISSLIFSSLFKHDKNAELVKDLVESYEISEDKKTYTISIKKDVKWHNGGALTSNDVYFTFNAIKDNNYKSPLRSGYTGVNIEVIDDYTFKFILSSPYAAFLELLTFGIMPADSWEIIPPESASQAGINLKPIGSGPFRYEQYTKEEKLGTIKEYRLVLNRDYYGDLPFLNINFKFYANFEDAINALNSGEIDGISYLPPDLNTNITKPKTVNNYKLYLPQITAIFINKEKNPALGDKAVRQALAYAIDTNSIINKVLNGGAYNVNGPILPNSFAYFGDIKKYDFNIAEAEKLLDGIDWKKFEINQEMIDKANEDINSDDEKIKAEAEKILSLGVGNWRKKNNDYLVVHLSTVERSENQYIVEEIKNNWENIGIKVELEIMPANQIQVKTIRPRQFELLFYGQVLGADPDPYPFWHSSQIGEQGLNITNFSNKEVDKLLEDARLTNDNAVRQEKYKKFQEIISEDVPAIFMYSPLYTYVQSNKAKGFDVKNIFVPSDRFGNISEWYMETEKKMKW